MKKDTILMDRQMQHFENINYPPNWFVNTVQLQSKLQKAFQQNLAS